ncbi:MAG: hypothetical protein Q8M47_07830, partial [Devosia sp.]|nr:hypothetical protein [Devosia sp.]
VPPGPMGEREASVANRAGLSITQLFVSPSAIDSWGDDRLGESVLEPGRSTRLKLGRMRDCAFDLLAVYEDASREERLGQNLCRSRNVVFDGRARVLPRLPVLQRRELILANRSARIIQQVFVSQADAPEWGEDLLGTAISVGETGTVVFLGACTVDIRVVFENRAAEERRGIDLCQGGSLSIEPGWTTADEPPAPPV